MKLKAITFSNWCFGVSTFFTLAISFLILVESCSSYDDNLDGSHLTSIHRDVIDLDGKKLDLSDADFIWYLVRHAEKDTIGENPNLSDLGLTRAARLADLFKKTKIDYIYTTYYNRCLQTADTVSQLKGMPMKIYKANKLKELVEGIKSSGQQRGVIIGHSNTIPATANVILGSQYFPKAIDESEYDNIYVISQKDSISQVYKLKY